MDSTVKEGKFQGGKKWQARRASLEEVEGSTAFSANRSIKITFAMGINWWANAKASQYL